MIDRERGSLSVFSHFLPAVLAATWLMLVHCHAEAQTIKVVGQPTSAGSIQSKLEAPFFANLSRRLGMSENIEYAPTTDSTMGVLAALRKNEIQLGSVRVSQLDADASELLGLDLIGLNSSYRIGARVVAAYTPVLNNRLQKKLGIRVLGAWPFGPQVLYCRKAITQLSEVRGLRIRVYDEDLGHVIESLGGIPVRLAFDDTRQALSNGGLDCAIASPTSANGAGWLKEVHHLLPLYFQLGINIYAISLEAWNGLNPDDQQKLQTAIQMLTNRIWDYSQRISRTAIDCAGDHRCGVDQRRGFHLLPVRRADVALVRETLKKVSLPVWAQRCESVDAGCYAAWKESVGHLIGLR